MELIPSPNPDVLCRTIGDESILVPIKNCTAGMNNIYVLSEVGKYIFDQLDGRRDVAAICKSIVRQYDIDADAALIDLNDFLDDLRTQDIVRLKQADGG